MTIIDVIFTAIVRAFFAFASLLGFRTREWKDFALRGQKLDEARELSSTVNSRGLMISWPFLTLASLLAHLYNHDKAIEPVAVFIIGLIILFILLIVIRVKAKFFRPLWVPPVIFVSITLLDAVFNLVLKDLFVGLVSK
jgi:TRAP-type uncharacterized transport system fused permease subunit